jgi:hypothetical protein
MSRLAKALVLSIAIWAILAGAWPIGILLLTYLSYGFLSKRNRTKQDTRVSGANNIANLGGLFLIALSVIALFGGGIFSPLVFGTLGTLLLLRGRIPGISIPSFLTVTEDSVLLRDRLLQFRWFLVAEIKFVTRQPAKALTSISGTIVIVIDGQARAFLVLESYSLRVSVAEAAFVNRLRETSKSLTHLGAYLMPLCGGEALSVINCGGQKLKLQEGSLFHSLATTPLDVIAVKVEGQSVKGIGVHSVSKRSGSPVLVGRAPKRPVSIWEVVKAIDTRVSWKEPDDATTFLGSLAATRGEPMGERLLDVRESDSQTLLVRSLRAPPIKLSLQQVRILVGTYS